MRCARTGRAPSFPSGRAAVAELHHVPGQRVPAQQRERGCVCVVAERGPQVRVGGQASHPPARHRPPPGAHPILRPTSRSILPLATMPPGLARPMWSCRQAHSSTPPLRSLPGMCACAARAAVPRLLGVEGPLPHRGRHAGHAAQGEAYATLLGTSLPWGAREQDAGLSTPASPRLHVCALTPRFARLGTCAQLNRLAPL